MREGKATTKTKTFLDIAIKAAKKAGAVHKKYFNTKLKKIAKSASFDLLTIADIEAEKAVVATVKKAFPGHNILAEENKYKKTDSPYTWIIDPLDGTNNFVCGMPIFCVSIALAKDGTVLVGVIYDAMRDELFCAQKNKGAYRNGKKIRVSHTAALQQSLLITGFYYDRGEKMRKNLGYMYSFLRKGILGVRRFGAAALDLCHVACGRATGYWEFELNPWDFAAGMLLVEEAGGKITDKKGNKLYLKPSFIVASNKKIHRQMLGVLRRNHYKSALEQCFK